MGKIGSVTHLRVVEGGGSPLLRKLPPFTVGNLEDENRAMIRAQLCKETTFLRQKFESLGMTSEGILAFSGELMVLKLSEDDHA